MNNPSAVDRILGEIREMIAREKLGVGDPLPTEVEIARIFGTSRNTVREAISTLKAYGIVETRKRVGPVLVDNRHSAISALFAFSQNISPEAFNDIQGFRRIVECGICDAVLEKRSEQDIQSLETLNAEMEEAEGVAEAAEKDYLFHLQIVNIVGNSTTCDVYRFLEPVIRRLLESGKSQRTSRVDIGVEHQGIIDAIRERDKFAYQYRMSRHLKSGLKFIS
ncbi:FCD domain-containing protein [uncultured Hoeflea sp.]|uniref:FadR/GntR family transcriptional regulator n=1 Tax=uncultured Hoeflea sp. TaxID=538666 RepID=UPI0026341CED|nr:FCD domain-containing protein [uncultured Hoeflea sp.]